MKSRIVLTAFAIGVTAAVLAAFLLPITVGGQEGGVKPGSPAFTESLTSKALPPASPKFGGEINQTAAQSKPWWPPRVVPPKGAPNVLLIMLDDAGYGSESTFGGTIPTPALDRIAKAGLRYTTFHSAALCSPTRAALITGRNHHAVHFGIVAEGATGYPGYDAIIKKDTATVADILKANGYGTSWFGKNHNVAGWLQTQAGPFDQWPVGMGFEYFYGFVGGDSSQWQPNLFRNTTPIEPYVGKPSWNLITAMADEAIGYMNQLHAVAPDKPFFVYYVPGATHAPHHPPREWIEKFKGKFDHGWNEERERIFANQKRLGVIPPNARLTAWPDSVPKWDTFSPEDKKMLARQAEVYAAYMAYTDHEIGRVIQAVEDMGKFDNTLVIYIGGDNGASPEGTTLGTPNEFASFNSVVIPLKEQMKYYDSWGSDQTFPHYAVGWAWAFGTPFKWTKQIASHFGGTRQGMAISWPARIKDAGGLRHQFHHVIDIVPTILEAAGVRMPDTVAGIPQRPLDGVSMVYTFDKANAGAPSRRTTQYFEMLAMRGIYHEGWMASTTPPFVPWAAFEGLPQKAPKDIVNGYTWELYKLDDDPTQADDVAAKYPEKVKEMQKIFMAEAAKHNVLPLDNRSLARFLEPKPSATAGRSVFTYTSELSNTPGGGAPSFLDRSYTITAEVDIPQAGAEGMLVTDGGRFGGIGFYLLKGKPVFVYNYVNLERFRWEAKNALAPGKHTLVFDFAYDGIGFGLGGKGTLRVDGTVVESKRIPKTMPFMFPEDETFDVGVDTRTPIDDRDYQVPFRFTGKLVKLTVELKPIKGTLVQILEFKLKERN
ncbi:MAG TPA: arylsulfatase [Candidatus Binatia bacterium]|nr:arylsulfatase [Candidatus Binatia bacterium]